LLPPDRHLSSLLSRSARALTALACAGALVVSLLGAATLAPEPALAATWTVDTASRTEDQIRAQWSALQSTYTGTPYAATPSWSSPYATGAVHSSFANDGLKMINFGRYIAGLPADVTLDAGRSSTVQYGAVLLAATRVLTHTPSQPSGMSDSFYQAGLSSTKSSNIGSGYQDSEGFQKGCFADSYSSTVSTVGHRRWLLNPAMKVTGIGFANSWHTTYAFDKSRTDTVSYTSINWPAAGYFPVEFFSSATPWSMTLNPARYDWDTTGHTVTLKRASDGKTWRFDASDYSASPSTSADFFNASFAGYGVGNAFIFRPAGVTYEPGDSFTVTLSGGIYLEGTKTPATVSYQTTFMTLAASAVDPEPVADGIVEDYSAGVTFDRFVPVTSSAYSGDSYTYGRWTGTEFKVKFNGTAISWIGPKQSMYGMADVYVDGTKVATVDCYAPASKATLAATIWETSGLKSGEHTVSIRLTGKKNAASTGYVVVMDTFDTGTTELAETATRANETAATFSGTWVNCANTTYTNGTYRYSRWAGTKMTYRFTGTGVTWIGPRAPFYGKADVYIDGVRRATVSQYGPLGWRCPVWDSGTLARGTHTLEIRVLGTKVSESTGAVVVVDSFDVRD